MFDNHSHLALGQNPAPRSEHPNPTTKIGSPKWAVNSPIPTKVLGSPSKRLNKTTTAICLKHPVQPSEAFRRRRQAPVRQLGVQLAVAALPGGHGAAVGHTQHAFEPRELGQFSLAQRAWK